MYETRSRPTTKRPPRNPNLPTDEERLAVVAGKLLPRKTKGQKSQQELVRTGKGKMPVGHPLGMTTGLPIFMAICYALQQNEKAPRDERLTDQGLADWFRAEFPGRDAKYWDKVQNLRSNYNSGRYTRGMVPLKKSHRYDSGGEEIDPVYRRKAAVRK